MRTLRTWLVLAPALFVATACGGTHWGYTGAQGPERWGDRYAACRGAAQSPVDIRQTRPAATPAPITFDYRDSRLSAVNNGHTIQVDYDPGSSITVGGVRYELLRLHFHRPAEERVQGRMYALDAHLVHRAADGTLAVVAVLFNEGAPQPTIDAIWRHMPKMRGERNTLANVMINAGGLLPADRSYYAYIGSLTEPPCSEGVRWYVLKTPLTVSAVQLQMFPFPANARPVQPLNGRVVEEVSPR
jgi:carbonic anhydrase